MREALLCQCRACETVMCHSTVRTSICLTRAGPDTDYLNFSQKIKAQNAALFQIIEIEL